MLTPMVYMVWCSDSSASTSAENNAVVIQQVKIMGSVAMESSTIESSDGTTGGLLSEH
ncbi:MAG: hypothetical protein H7X84_10285 [Verrucomicrobia bacterium]|nr:hypothetical protein [Prolixibacteraceae bacterium]